jgi:hypothetical protein
MQTLERVVLVMSHTRRIPKEQPEQNEGTRGNLASRSSI